jgi:hypothetical protein
MVVLIFQSEKLSHIFFIV